MVSHPGGWCSEELVSGLADAPFAAESQALTYINFFDKVVIISHNL